MPTSPNKQDNTAQIAYWNDKAAITWTTFQERLDALFQPLTALALDAAKPASGERAVDVGCGCGATVLALAERIGSAGQVLGLDVSGPMAARARERIAAAGLSNAQVVVSDAATTDFERRDADLLFSRFGVMFFADPVAAFANLHLAMRPGGRLLCAAWRPLADNPWFRVPLEAARSFVPPQPPADPEAPGPFAFADLEMYKSDLFRGGMAGCDALEARRAAAACRSRRDRTSSGFCNPRRWLGANPFRRRPGNASARSGSRCSCATSL